jgi:hypothetical protein
VAVDPFTGLDDVDEDLPLPLLHAEATTITAVPTARDGPEQSSFPRPPASMPPARLHGTPYY